MGFFAYFVLERRLSGGPFLAPLNAFVILFNRGAAISILKGIISLKNMPKRSLNS